MDSIKELLQGYKAYRSNEYRRDRALFRTLAKHGQSPLAMVISCCDSRVEPTTFLDTAPGDLFMVRNVANLVPPYLVDSRHHGTSAALEYAVTALEVPNIIVIGHSQCGGIKALVDGIVDETDTSSFIANWMSIAKSAKEKAVACGCEGEELQQKVEEGSILNSLENLRSFPFIQERLKDGRLELHGWYFDFTTGELSHYDEEQNCFVKFEE